MCRILMFLPHGDPFSNKHPSLSRGNPVVSHDSEVAMATDVYTTSGSGREQLVQVTAQNVHVSRFMFTFTFTCNLQAETQRDPNMEVVTKRFIIMIELDHVQLNKTFCL